MTDDLLRPATWDDPDHPGLPEHEEDADRGVGGGIGGGVMGEGGTAIDRGTGALAGEGEEPDPVDPASVAYAPAAGADWAAEENASSAGDRRDEVGEGWVGDR